ncbi:peptidase M4 [Rhodococcus sp. 15-649-1-2]|uniref:M4 family metallopeptidase n=1 Tax=Rhodococcus sp. 114MFTsu3.1 TaxID=1172184 RepID=UPI000382C246|nr:MULTISPECIES: M4 family metallopeptidase [unclassified Rhodococcus (in: high G+C Gram-positive bacteria)]OZD60359.1 peptidase M4 [Rhodococcus sp. 06-1059B-a]OZE76483.1 peptidase M4 [Rhodococcus sp. 15-649-1-2]
MAIESNSSSESGSGSPFNRNVSGSGTFPSSQLRTVVPPFLLERIAESASSGRGQGVVADHASSSAARTLAIDRQLARGRSPLRSTVRASSAAAAEGPVRSIHDAQNRDALPGRLVRSEGEPASGDVSVDEAYDGLGTTFAFFREVYGYESLDGKGLPLSATVHFDRDYDNAFWDGERMVFGDGDGEVFGRFTASLSVIAHELTHGFTQYTSALEYFGQAGALNESLSDVFGVLVEQYSSKQDAKTASWLVGEGLFLPAVEGRALRSMIDPGTAYDDDILGRDPQPKDMDGYVETTADNGGVHINSSIPNRAFASAARALGGPAWDRAGQVWFDVATDSSLPSTVDFEGFAAATVSAAVTRYGAESDVHRAVAAGWATVGVVVDAQEPAESSTRRV